MADIPNQLSSGPPTVSSLENMSLPALQTDVDISVRRSSFTGSQPDDLEVFSLPGAHVHIDGCAYEKISSSR
jgi:hypothetical protein